MSEVSPHRQHNSMKNTCPVCGAAPGANCTRLADAGLWIDRRYPHIERNADCYPELHRSPGAKAR